MLNFTWWVNRKDAQENNVFQGGFLGLDNIGVFDRNTTLPDGMVLEQSDGTAWMGMFGVDHAGDGPGTGARRTRSMKTWRPNSSITSCTSPTPSTVRDRDGQGLWNDEDGFFYDKLEFPDGQQFPLKVRSLVGLIPLLAVETAETDLVEGFLE